MKIKSIEIQNFHNISKKKYEFKDINYLVGSNGSGKSTVMEAIQLCLLGYIPNTNKQVGAIFAHSNKSPLSIKLVLEGKQEVTIERSYEKVKTKIDSNFSITPDNVKLEDIIGNIELPILNFNEFLSLNKNKQKDLLVSILPSFRDTIKTKKYLTEVYLECKEANEIIKSYGYESEIKTFDDSITTAQSIHDIINDVSKEMPELKNIEDIKELNSKLKEIQSANNAEEKRLSSTAQSLIYYDDYDGETDCEVIKKDIENYTERKDNLIRITSQNEFVNNQKAKLMQYDDLKSDILLDPIAISLIEEVDSLNVEIFELKDKINECSKEKNLLSDKKHTLSGIVSSDGICPLLPDNYSCQHLNESIKKFNNDIVDIDNSIYQLNETIDKYSSENVKLENKLSECNNKLDELKIKYKERDSILDSMCDIAVIDEPLTVEELQMKIEELTDNLTKASANEAYQNLLETIQKQKFEIEINSVFLKSVIKATGENGLQTSLMVKPFEKLAREMNSILSTMGLESIGSVEFILKTTANSFEFGFNRDGKFIPFNMISSGEKCIFLLSFMVSLVKVSDSKFDVVMIDDLLDHLDDNRLISVISNIDKINNDVQFIFAGVQNIEEPYSLYINLIPVSEK